MTNIEHNLNQRNFGYNSLATSPRKTSIHIQPIGTLVPLINNLIDLT